MGHLVTPNMPTILNLVLQLYLTCIRMLTVGQDWSNRLAWSNTSGLSDPPPPVSNCSQTHWSFHWFWVMLIVLSCKPSSFMVLAVSYFIGLTIKSELLMLSCRIKKENCSHLWAMSFCLEFKVKVKGNAWL